MKRRRSLSGSSDDISETGSESSEDSVSSSCSEDTVVKKYGYLTGTFHHDLSDNRLYQVTGVGTSEHEGETYVVGYRKRYNGNAKYLYNFFFFIDILLLYRIVGIHGTANEEEQERPTHIKDIIKMYNSFCRSSRAANRAKK
jgi:hypothetical protein